MVAERNLVVEDPAPAPVRRPDGEPFRGVILCGGSSRRMGRDKAYIEVEGVPLVLVAAGALRAAGATAVCCVGGDAERLGRLGLTHVPDDQPGEGPLGALLTAFERHPSGVAMVLTCDLPLVDACAVTAVIDTLGRHPHAGVAAPRLDGRLQLLCAAYRPAMVLDPLRSAFGSGRRAVRAVLAHVEVAEVELVGELAAKLRDADTPQVLAELTDQRPQGTFDGGTRPLPAPLGSTTVSDHSVPEVDVAEAARRHQQGTVLLDVREPDEFADIHARGARLLPLSELTERVAEVPMGQPLLIICRSGARSARAAEWLNDRGAQATNVAGGTLAWVEANLPTATGSSS